MTASYLEHVRFVASEARPTAAVPDLTGQWQRRSHGRARLSVRDVLAIRQWADVHPEMPVKYQAAYLATVYQVTAETVRAVIRRESWVEV